MTLLVAGAPLSLNKRNSHYFEFRQRATVLVTSGEHYGALINEDFNYRRYLDTLASDHLNLTRVWTGSYRELPGDFHIGNNTLAPVPERFISPWMRSDKPGALDGGNRFDLTRWNPAYFTRLHDFLGEASRRNIIAEINLFCTYYKDAQWKASPLNAANNVNGIGNVPRSEALAMTHPDLLRAEDALVRKIVTEVNSFDNLYFEICNEPYWGKVTPDWQRHISTVITDTERHLPQRHLISQNIANDGKKIEHADPNVSIFNFHYAQPALSIAPNYELNRPIGDNETGFNGQADSTYRMQGWAFLAAGGALYNNLDYSFTAGHESGEYRYSKETPGGGSTELRKQLGILARFFESLNLQALRPAGELVRQEPSDSAKLSALAAPGDTYMAYLYRSRGGKLAVSNLLVSLPAGHYRALWIEPKTGSVLNTFEFDEGSGERSFSSPAYSEDVLLKVIRS